MIEVLHFSAHLGGGVGKAISTLVTAARATGTPVRHVVVCLTPPEKMQFVERIRAAGGEVLISPEREELRSKLLQADIVQIEWWNHPATIEALCALTDLPIRLLVWCHVSGLHNPVIPGALIDAAKRFVFTSPCSLAARNVAERANQDKLSVISSAGGFETLPLPRPQTALPAEAPLAVGYMGSLNFAKLHPAYIEFLAAVRLPSFRVRLIGDELNRAILESQCAAIGHPDLLDFRGYVTDIATEMATLDVLAYLLNPRHYGTAENALLEAMAMGIVPVVFDNPAERCIVNHGETGLVISSPAEFADAIEWLSGHPSERHAMGMRASQTVRENFTGRRMEAAFASIYRDLVAEDKSDVAFQNIFGRTPDAWFLSCQAQPEVFTEDGRAIVPGEGGESSYCFDLVEATKGSVFHFQRHFPENARLAEWARRIDGMKDARTRR